MSVPPSLPWRPIRGRTVDGSGTRYRRRRLSRVIREKAPRVRGTAKNRILAGGSVNVDRRNARRGWFRVRDTGRRGSAPETMGVDA